MEQPALVYETIILNKDDYDFFNGLTTREKILFLYDLCLEVENLEEESVVDEDELFTSDLLRILATESRNELYVHVLILDDIIIFSGNLEESITNTKRLFFNDGFIFTKCKLNYPDINEHVQKLSNFFKIIEVHDLISYSIPMSLN